MLSLLNLQRAFVATIDGNVLSYDIDMLDDHIGGGAERLDVYANTVRINRQNVLRAVYPVAERLVGAEFFGYAAGHFAKLYPSRSGNLDDYGAEFAEFLAAFEPAASLLYLPDVARLELAIDRLTVAADRHVNLPVAIRLDTHLRLMPGAQLLKSDFPIYRIWQVNQPGHAGDVSVDLSEGGVRLLVRRSGFAVELIVLDTAEFAFLAALAAGASVGRAIAASADEAPLDFDPVSCLCLRLDDGTLRATPSHAIGAMRHLFQQQLTANGTHHGL